MKKRIWTIIVCMLVVATVFPMVASSIASKGNIIYVDDDAGYTNIRGVINKQLIIQYIGSYYSLDDSWLELHYSWVFLGKYAEIEPTIPSVGKEQSANIPPTANFTYSPLNPTDLDYIQFNDTSIDPDGTIVEWYWEFGDGKNSTEQNTTYQYTDDGTYLVNLTVWDDYDVSNRTQKAIVVSNVPPVADANGPYYGYVNELIQFNGSGSYDPDAGGLVSINKGIVRYEWNFGDGHNGSGMKPTYRYTHDGTYCVTLTVWDDDGDTDMDCTPAVVIYGYQMPPNADANGPYEGRVNESIQFHGSATGGKKPYSWYWDFGNGYSSTLQNPTQIYNRTGVYSVLLTVTDDNGNSDNDTTTATIHPESALIADAGGPYSGYVNETVQFNGSASGGEIPYSWYWEFGDGDTSTLQNPIHIYDTTDEYTAVLAVTDDFGQTDNDAASVTITERDNTPPTVMITKPVKALYINDKEITPFFVPLIFGDIQIWPSAYDNESGFNRLELYIDEDLKETFTSVPKSWTWDETVFGRRTIKLVAYDNAGNPATAEINVWKFF